MNPSVADPALRIDSIHTLQWRAGVLQTKQTRAETAGCICDCVGYILYVTCAICEIVSSELRLGRDPNLLLHWTRKSFKL
jgi:hypothetical protein